ncbi:MAG: hypothetical protein A2010_08075 [Nitrospirae bacterium GWD2_57_9]|nr:MAG: hypothetical protein A2010_08075 [Nitrospirae bacterium GWD2_57_9]
MNDADAQFCSECGRPMEPAPAQGKTRKPYLYALLLIPVLVLAGGIGYYKYVLPQGIAAVVNGEEIMASELDSEVVRTTGSREAADGRLRYQVLNSLITERLILQEARKAGMSTSGGEISLAVVNARSGSGLDEAGFRERVESQYGSMQAFERALGRRLLVNRFVAERIIPADADPRTARAALDRWLQERSDAASVRVTLAEQWSGAGCGCCANKAEASPAPPAASGGCRMAKNSSAAAGNGTAAAAEASRTGQAADAGLRYWQEKHGAENVTAKVTDFGCHMQVDIVKDNKTIGSLRYQGGVISEQ